ncbi:MAG: hypothetical protein H9Q67_07210, partial [Spiroplasma ixodetis]|nr:hypothetical protein [Spiroplasma ixodetis]
MEINIKEKEQLLEKAIKQIEKEFGKGAIMLLSDSSIGDIEVISSGSILLDDILGVKGFPKGRIIEVYGPESAGKTREHTEDVNNIQICLKIIKLDENNFDFN